MKNTELAFLNLLRAALHEDKPDDPALAPEDWEALLRLAEEHKLLPLILDAACALPSCAAALKQLDKKMQTEASSTDGKAAQVQHARSGWRELVLEQVSRQAAQENEFLDLILALRERGLEPAVMKGPVCRALYPKPLLRPSVDDDLLIPDELAGACHEALLDLGLTADDPEADPDKAWELSYHKPDSPLYLELHKRLFEPGSAAFRNFNEPFAEALERAVPVKIQDVALKTLAPTDHLLFLILHAFKHFLYSGFGVRIVSDICLFSREYREQIDFAQIFRCCAACRGERFAAAVYRIGEKYLDLPVPEPFAVLDVDEAALLSDVLASGIHGASIDRLHSASITLGAVSDQNEGKARSGGLSKTLFPSAKRLTVRYPWLEKRPWLLPVAWGSRVVSYLRERGRYGEQSPAASLRIGKERTGLLTEYGVIDP